jgi:phage terminase small subunit
MSRGGYRPGAGRPKGSGKAVKTAPVPSLKFPSAVDSAAQEAGLSPMDYLLRLMRNPDEDAVLRARAAALLLPFLHPRTVEAGKKTKAQEAAATAEVGTDWEELLNPTRPQ